MSLSVSPTPHAPVAADSNALVGVVDSKHRVQSSSQSSPKETTIAHRGNQLFVLFVPDIEIELRLFLEDIFRDFAHQLTPRFKQLHD